MSLRHQLLAQRLSIALENAQDAPVEEIVVTDGTAEPEVADVEEVVDVDALEPAVVTEVTEEQPLTDGKVLPEVAVEDVPVTEEDAEDVDGVPVVGEEPTDVVEGEETADVVEDAETPVEEVPAEDAVAEEPAADDVAVDDAVVEPELTDEVPAEEVVEGEVPAEGEEPLVAEEPEVPAEVMIDTAAEEILEINASGDDLEVEEAAIDGVSEVVEGLESIALAMEQSIAVGGLTAMAAEGYSLAVEAYCSRVELPSVMPGLESFGGSGSRKEQTQLSIENLQEKAGQLWQAILEMLEKARKMAVEFFKKVFTNVGQLKGKATAIAKAADGLGAATSTSVAGSNIAKLTVNGKPAGDVAGELKKLGGLLTTAYKYSDEAIGYAEAVGNGVASLDANGDEKFVSSIKSLVEAVTKATPTFSAASNDYKGNDAGGVGLGGKQTDTFLGEVSVAAIRFDGSNIDQNAQLRALGGQRNVVSVGTADTPESVDTLKAEQIKAIAAAVVEIVESVEGYKDTAAKVDKSKDVLGKAGKSFERNARKAETLSAENKRLINAVLGVAKSVPGVVDQPANKLTQHTLSVCQAALKYCAASIKAYGKGEVAVQTAAA